MAVGPRSVASTQPSVTDNGYIYQVHCWARNGGTLSLFLLTENSYFSMSILKSESVITFIVEGEGMTFPHRAQSDGAALVFSSCHCVAPHSLMFDEEYIR